MSLMLAAKETQKIPYCKFSCDGMARVKACGLDRKLAAQPIDPTDGRTLRLPEPQLGSQENLQEE